MANEIYDSTWWGNTIDTASSIGTSTEMIQGQFNLTKLGDELVTNGDFATDSDWAKNTNWNISGGAANADGTSSNPIFQNNVVTANKPYKVTFTITDISQGTFYIDLGLSTSGIYYSSIGTYTETIVSGSGNTRIYFRCTGNTIGSIDNVSVKEVRATTVEASKCLADTIHRIGLQDIQN